MLANQALQLGPRSISTYGLHSAIPTGTNSPQVSRLKLTWVDSPSGGERRNPCSRVRAIPYFSACLCWQAWRLRRPPGRRGLPRAKTSTWSQGLSGREETHSCRGKMSRPLRFPPEIHNTCSPANDYRTVDLNLVDQLPINQLSGDA